MSKSKSVKPGGRPWRDNIEAITVSIITIVLFKYFVLEAYKIPTGSMQPTLMGNTETGIFDRVLVDKFSLHYRDPERYEVVVFKYPLNHAQNFIKRILGMPGEELEIRAGDLWRRPLDAQGEGTGDWTILRRSREIQASQLRLLETEDEWNLVNAQWRVDGDSVIGEGPGRAEFPRTVSSVRDGYTDGYPKGIKAKIQTRNKGSNLNQVSDLRATASVSGAADTTELRFVLREGPRQYRFLIPGPAAAADARPTIEAIDPLGGMSRVTSQAAEAWQLEAGKSVDVLIQNLDDLLELVIEGAPTLTLEVPPADKVRTSGLALESEDGGAEFANLRVYRDIFYTARGQKQTRWTIPEGHYVMLGDNSQDSSDGRDWTLTGLKIVDGDDAGESIWGNNRQGENPLWVDYPGGQRDVFFRDELGELRYYPESAVKALSPLQAPLVSRESIVGRAVLVVWPLSPSNQVYRLKWVR